MFAFCVSCVFAGCFSLTVDFVWSASYNDYFNSPHPSPLGLSHQSFEGSSKNKKVVHHGNTFKCGQVVGPYCTQVFLFPHKDALILCCVKAKLVFKTDFKCLDF